MFVVQACAVLVPHTLFLSLIVLMLILFRRPNCDSESTGCRILALSPNSAPTEDGEGDAGSSAPPSHHKVHHLIAPNMFYRLVLEVMSFCESRNLSFELWNRAGCFLIVDSIIHDLSFLHLLSPLTVRLTFEDGSVAVIILEIVDDRFNLRYHQGITIVEVRPNGFTASDPAFLQLGRSRDCILELFENRVRQVHYQSLSCEVVFLHPEDIKRKAEVVGEVEGDRAFDMRLPGCNQLSRVSKVLHEGAGWQYHGAAATILGEVLTPGSSLGSSDSVSLENVPFAY